MGRLRCIKAVVLLKSFEQANPARCAIVNDQNRSPAEFRVLSDTRGRLRVRLLGTPRKRRSDVEQLSQTLAMRPIVTSFRANPSTGSVTLHYDADVHRVEDILEVLFGTGLRREQLDGTSVRLEPAGASDVAVSVVDAVNQLDARLSRMMRRRIDLKAAVPLTLVALGMWKTATQGVGWKQIPAYQLFWYAYATFRELNVESAVEALTRESSEIEPNT